MEHMGIIRDIHVGFRDNNKPVVWFTVETLIGNSLQVIDDVEGFIFALKFYKLEDLEGKPCVVSYVDGIMSFMRMFK